MSATTLPEPSFIDRDIDAITKSCVAWYEAKTGKTLQPAQSERIMIDLIAYREQLIRIGIQQACLQNLVNFAGYPMLDYLGDLVDCPRILAQYAITTILFTLTELKTYDVTIPQGTEILSKDGKVAFATNSDLIIKQGTLTGTVGVTATTAGIIGNGYLIGEVNTLNTTIAEVASVSNTVATSGGAEEEENDAYRERIKEAPEGFSQAGSRGAYSYLTKSANASIIDVAVLKPQDNATIMYTIDGNTYTATADKTGKFTGEKLTNATVDYTTGEAELVFNGSATSVVVKIPPAGIVKIYPLTSDGNPSDAVIAQVKAILSDETKRPLTDNVIVATPEKVDFSISADVVVLASASQADVKAAVETKLAAYVATLKASLQNDIIPARIISEILSVDGTYNATLNAPTYKALTAYQWANCTGITVNVSGVQNG